MSHNSGLFIYLMDLAWRCRISLPVLLTCSMALLGQACVLHINISTRPVRENPIFDGGDTSSESSDSDASS